jgi:hypothetical protein
MKFVLIILLIAISSAHGNFSGLIKTMAATCKAKENASDADVEDLSNFKAPNTPEGKCLIACLAEQFGIVKLILTKNMHFCEFKLYCLDGRQQIEQGCSVVKTGSFFWKERGLEK